MHHAADSMAPQPQHMPALRIRTVEYGIMSCSRIHFLFCRSAPSPPERFSREDRKNRGRPGGRRAARHGRRAAMRMQLFKYIYRCACRFCVTHIDAFFCFLWKAARGGSVSFPPVRPKAGGVRGGGTPPREKKQVICCRPIGLGWFGMVGDGL